MKTGRFGDFGGQYVPETVMNAVHELEDAYNKYKDDPEFNRELQELFRDYAGRPSMLYYAERMTKDLGGAKVYLKREDLNHTGAHKINNVLGQILLAKKMGKKRVIAETGAGQHGVATATVCALFGLECEIYMGAEDVKRQSLNVYRMNLLGAKCNSVHTGTATLKDAVNEAMRDWCANIETTFYCICSAMGPHPYPQMVRDFQKVISKEIKEQLLEKEGKLPDCVIACCGGGSNAIGAFYNFIEDKSVRLVGAEAAGRGVDTKEHAATLTKGTLGTGETDENFSETLRFIQGQPFSKIHVFPYSARQGTLAATLPNQIPPQIKKSRANLALEVSRAKSKAFAERLIGKTVEIIAETSQGGLVDGLTKNYVRVYVPDENLPLGSVLNVKIERLHKDGVAGFFR